MINVKHFMDAVEESDGRRIWVEPIGLTKELQEWCRVEHLMTHLAPPRELCDWFEEHPDGYGYFRGKYHTWLDASPYRPALRQLVKAATRENVTLLHQGDDPQQNSATAL